MTNITSYNPEDKVKVIENIDQIEIGQWYWVDFDNLYREKNYPIQKSGKLLVCITEIGSNYLEITFPTNSGKYNNETTSSQRIHVDRFYDRFQFEPNADAIIQENIVHHKKRVSGQLDHIKRIQQEFSIPTDSLLEHKRNDTNNALVVVSEDNKNLVEYKRDLKNVKKHLIPKLVNRVKRGSNILSGWMSAETLALKATTKDLDKIIHKVDDQIFNVNLYVGLSEYTKKVRDGEPAKLHDKIHIMQRMMFMDEECLLDYEAGGMEFSSLSEFDNWLMRNENFKRLLPFEKCIGIFRIRRNTKERFSNSIDQIIMNFELEQMDRWTYMYCRNGEQIHRVTIENFDFAEKIFPNKENNVFGKELMVKRDSSKYKIMSVEDYEYHKNEWDNVTQLEEEWLENYEGDNSWIHNPYRNKKHSMVNVSGYELLNYDNLYYDDAIKYLFKEIDKFNKTALIIQGLLDRSDIFTPTSSVKLRNPSEFNKYITLVYDADMVLSYGEAPSIEDYIEKCNNDTDQNSVFYGQQGAWEIIEREKEEKRYYNRYEDNPGPAKLMKCSNWMPRARKATFRWYKGYSDWKRYGERQPTSVTIPIEELFNVSTYKKGDYKKFFNDPRTRQEYLKWAPLLLTAEDYVNGKIKVEESI